MCDGIAIGSDYYKSCVPKCMNAPGYGVVALMQSALLQDQPRHRDCDSVTQLAAYNSMTNSCTPAIVPAGVMAW